MARLTLSPAACFTIAVSLQAALCSAYIIPQAPSEDWYSNSFGDALGGYPSALGAEYGPNFPYGFGSEYGYGPYPGYGMGFGPGQDIGYGMRPADLNGKDGISFEYKKGPGSYNFGVNAKVSKKFQLGSGNLGAGFFGSVGAGVDTDQGNVNTDFGSRLWTGVRDNNGKVNTQEDSLTGKTVWKNGKPYLYSEYKKRRGGKASTVRKTYELPTSGKSSSEDSVGKYRFYINTYKTVKSQKPGQ